LIADRKKVGHAAWEHVLIAVTVKRPDMTFAEDAWSARVVFTLEAGEQLAEVARGWHPHLLSDRTEPDGARF
jgi:hypothetical protein